MSRLSYTIEQLKFISSLRNSGLDWLEVSKQFNEKFGTKKTRIAIRKTYARYEDENLEELSDDVILKNITERHRTSETNRILRKENKLLASSVDDISAIVEEFEKLLKKVKLKKVKIPKAKKTKGLTSMTLEALISDTHYGLKTKSFDSDIARDRMRSFTDALLAEEERYSKNYNVEEFILLLNGDIIQSATMHKDSGKSCHLTNAEQLAVAIESLFFDLIYPVATRGKKVKIIATSGNHDREDSQRFTVDPGNSYYSYTIYKSLELLCKACGLDNVKIDIPKKAYHVYTVYGSNFVVEHGDLIRSNKENDLEQHLMKRAAQVGKLLQGIRFGHYHNDKIGSIGRYIGNGSLVSDDHFGDGLGYVSRPCQVINYYVNTKKRNTSYYHSFVVNLG
jgi:predicted phosphodiesterase